MLVSNSENKSQDFTKFQKSIHHHVLATFKNSKDLSTAIQDFIDPYKELKQNVPTLAKIQAEYNLIPGAPQSKEMDKEKFKQETENSDNQEMAKMKFSNQIKLNKERNCWKYGFKL